MSLSEFTSKVKTEGLAKSNQYVVILTMPKNLSAAGAITKAMALYCSEVTVPGVSLNVSTVNTGIHNFASPDGLQFSPVTAAFYDDSNFIIRQFFDTWMNQIVSFQDKTIAWKDDYVATMEIHRLDMQNNVMYKITLEEVFPVIIQDQQLAYGQAQITKQPVQFTYTKWTTEKIVADNNRPGGFSMASADVFSSIIGQQKLNLPTGGGFFDNLMAQNSWLDSAYRTAGSVVGLYQQGRNSYDQLIGTGKQIKSIVDFAKKTKSLDGLIKAGSGLGSVLGSSTNANTPLGGIIQRAPDIMNRSLDSLKRATIKLPF